MGFLAKGERIILKPGQGSEEGTYLFKVQNEDGSFSDGVWGSRLDNFETAIVSSTWTTYDSYKYLNIGLVRQVYSEPHTFDRNIRFDSLVRVSNTVSPVDADISGIEYITAVVKGSLTADASTLVQTVIDEFTADSYTDVLAIGRMNKDIADYRPINVDVNDIKTYAGTAQSTLDYELPTDVAIYLVNIALLTNAEMEGISSLSVNVYAQEFIEFLGDNAVAPGTIGKTEIDPDYKAERAINNHIIVIDDEKIVDSGTTIVFSPDETVQIDNNSIYYIYFDTNNTSGITHLSLGYYDVDEDEYIASGTKYAVTLSGTVANKVCTAVCINNAFTIKALQ